MDETDSSAFLITGKLYDRLKFLAMILLPALGTLYFALAGLWDLPKAMQVVGTVTAVDLFLGTILGLSTRAYKKAVAQQQIEETGAPDIAGAFVMQRDEDGGVSVKTLEIYKDPMIFNPAKHLVFEVKPPE